MNFSIKKLTLPLKEKFKISHSEFHRLDHILIILEHKEIKAFGEIVPIAFFNEPYDQALHQAQTLLDKEHAEIQKIQDVSDLRQWVAKLKNGNYLNCVICGLEMALLDYLGKTNRRMIWELLELGPPERRRTPLTLPIKDQQPAGYKNLSDGMMIKVKLGGASDPDYLEFVRQHPGKEFILDVNQGWKLDELRKYRESVNQSNVLFLEEPVRIETRSVLIEARNLIPETPLFLDESVKKPADAMEYIDYIDGVNIKVTKFGGLIHSLEAAQSLRSKNIRLMLGCFLESSLSISYAFSISGLFDFLDLDGATFIKNQPFTGVRIDKGEIIPDFYGFGIGVKHG